MNDNPVQSNTDVNATPQHPQGSPSMKPEHEPLGSFVKHSEAEPILPPEVSEQGTEVVNQHVPNLSQEVKAAGVVHAKETNAPNLSPSANLPLTQQEAHLGKKSGVGNSLTWLSTLVLKVFRA